MGSDRLLTGLLATAAAGRTRMELALVARAGLLLFILLIVVVVIVVLLTFLVVVLLPVLLVIVLIFFTSFRILQLL